MCSWISADKKMFDVQTVCGCKLARERVSVSYSFYWKSAPDQVKRQPAVCCFYKRIGHQNWLVDKTVVGWWYCLLLVLLLLLQNATKFWCLTESFKCHGLFISQKTGGTLASHWLFCSSHKHSRNCDAITRGTECTLKTEKEDGSFLILLLTAFIRFSIRRHV